MKKIVKMLRIALPIVLCTSAIAVNAQRGYRGNYNRGNYSRGYSHDYANSYRGYSPAYRGNYNNAYSYRSPVITRNYNPIVFAPKYYGFPHGGISLTFGGNPYYYSGGAFYRPYGGYYRSIFPRLAFM